MRAPRGGRRAHCGPQARSGSEVPTIQRCSGLPGHTRLEAHRSAARLVTTTRAGLSLLQMEASPRVIWRTFDGFLWSHWCPTARHGAWRRPGLRRHRWRGPRRCLLRSSDRCGSDETTVAVEETWALCTASVQLGIDAPGASHGSTNCGPTRPTPCKPTKGSRLPVIERSAVQSALEATAVPPPSRK
jgi:hypothetical protein